LQHCLPLIRFFSLLYVEFSRNVRPYQKLLDKDLAETLMDYFFDRDSVPAYKISRPRNIKIMVDGVIYSQIVGSAIIVSTVSRWIDKEANYQKSYLPYKFELLLRGSRDGFSPKIFHKLCDGKRETVTFIKIKGTKNYWWI
jgi:hypothetical protein